MNRCHSRNADPAPPGAEGPRRVPGRAAPRGPGLAPDELARLRRRIGEGYYDRPEVLDAVARALLLSRTVESCHEGPVRRV